MQDVLDAVGVNISKHRKSQRMSQEDLGLKSGVPRSTIAGIEAGSANPTLKNLLLIASALQISIQELTTLPRAEVQFIPKAEIEVLEKSRGGAVIRKMLPDPIPGMEIDYVSLEPNMRIRGVPHMKGSKEYMICTSGKISVFVEGEYYECSPGDCLAFRGDQAHSYMNPGRGKAEFVGVVVLAPHGV